MENKKLYCENGRGTERYEKPVIEIIELKNDSIVTSGGCDFFDGSCTSDCPGYCDGNRR